jgi:hypothetical protein
MKSRRFQWISEVILACVQFLWDQVADRDKLRFAAHEASDFLERCLFLGSKRMYIFSGLIEALVGAAKFVAPRVCRNQTKVLVEFVPDAATPRGDAFQHRKSKAAMFDFGIRGYIQLKQGSVQIAPREQQA